MGCKDVVFSQMDGVSDIGEMEKRTVVVTGANGQLGQEVVKQLSQRYEVHGFSHESLDVTDRIRVRSFIQNIRPDVIIHTAAYTAVDQAEDEREEAERVNVQGTHHIASIARDIDAVCCYMSTDYVFNGRTSQPYNEGDQPDPINHYGLTKYVGEQIVRAMCRKYFVIRTSWLYGLFGANFVLKMLELAARGQVIQVVDDQVGCPTYVPDLVKFMAELIATDRYGVYHASNAGSCSWYEFACEIFALCQELGDGRFLKLGQTGGEGPASELSGGERAEGEPLDGGQSIGEQWRAVQVLPCSSAQYPSKAPRPAYSVLDQMAMREAGFAPLRHWREALRAFLLELG